MTLGNNFSRPLLRPGGDFSSAFGKVGEIYLGVQGRCFIVFRVMLLLAFFLKDAVLSVGFVVGGGLDRAQSPLGGGGRRWRVQIWELEELGRSPSQWVTADGFIPFSMTGVNFDSAQS